MSHPADRRSGPQPETEQTGPVRIRIADSRGRQPDGCQAFGLKTEIHAKQLEEALAQQTGADEQHDGRRQLHDDELESNPVPGRSGVPAAA